MFADYKGQRKPTPSELSEQFPLARRLLEAMNITVLETDGYEADDIIGTFAVHAPQNAEIIIVTGDKDELQLLDDRVKVYFTKRGISDIKAYDVAAFAADYEGLNSWSSNYKTITLNARIGYSHTFAEAHKVDAFVAYEQSKYDYMSRMVAVPADVGLYFLAAGMSDRSFVKDTARSASSKPSPPPPSWWRPMPPSRLPTCSSLTSAWPSDSAAVWAEVTAFAKEQDYLFSQ